MFEISLKESVSDVDFNVLGLSCFETNRSRESK